MTLILSFFGVSLYSIFTFEAPYCNVLDFTGEKLVRTKVQAEQEDFIINI